MPDVYANDFRGITQGDLGYANLRQRSLESALQNALSSISQLKQRQMLSDQFTQKLAQEKEQYKQHADFLEKSRQDRLNIYSDEAPMRQSQLNYQEALTNKLEREPSPAQAKEDESLTRLAEIAAGEGEDVTGMGLPPVREKLLSRISSNANARNQDAYLRANALSQALNRELDLKATKAKADSAAEVADRGHHWWQNLFSTGENPADIERANSKMADEQLKDLGPRLQTLKEDKTLMQLVRPNGRTGRWEPAVRPGRQINMATPGAAPTDAPAASQASQAVDNTQLPRGPAVSPGRAISNEPGAVSSPLINDEGPAPMYGTARAPVAAAAGQSGSKRDWVLTRAKELTSKGMAPSAAVARARLEFEQTE